MKILQVITSLGIGGAEHLVLQLVQKLRQKGHKVDVCVFNGMRSTFMTEMENTGCKIYSLGSSFYNPLYIFNLTRIMKDYDIVHSHNSSPQLYTALANLKSKRKLITTEHNTDNRKRHLFIAKGIDRWMYSRYGKTICISEETEFNLRHYLGNSWQKRFGNDKIVTIYNGIDFQRFSNAQPISSEKSKFIIVMVAAFRPQKDHMTLLKAMTHLSDLYSLWLVGDGELRPRIETEIKKLNLQHRVRLFGNRVDVPEIIKSSKVVVMSSNWEGFGLAAVEGMAAGKPVVASDVDGLKQIVEGYGMLFHHGNDRDLAVKIKSLFEDNHLYNQIAQRCTMRAMMYDIDKMISDYELIYFRSLRNDRE